MLAISEFYNSLNSEYNLVKHEKPFRLAVRSSAIGEDSEDSSSAGQNDTFLGLTSLEAVLDGVRKCWASLYTFQSVEYRRQHVQPIDTQMAVVVQVMVASECAGVLFTQHPSNGDPSKMLITANFGLGEVGVNKQILNVFYYFCSYSLSFRELSNQIRTPLSVPTVVLVLR